ncbi:CD1247 N-terminal domain-containing protein [Ruminococcus sp.]
MNLTDKMAYLCGMVDGMELDLTSSKEGKVLGKILDVMQEMTAYIVDLQTQVDELTDTCDLLDQDLGDLEDIVFDEDDDEDDDEYDDYYDEDEDNEIQYETVCPTCKNTIVLSESILDKGEMPCPCCGQKLEFGDVTEADFAEDADETESED